MSCFAGLRDAIGVFLWATESAANQKIHAVNSLDNNSSVLTSISSFNGTTAEVEGGTKSARVDAS